MTLTEKERRVVGKYLRSTLPTTSQVRIGSEGAVTVRINPMPDTNKEGWIFAGWDTDLLMAATR